MVHKISQNLRKRRVGSGESIRKMLDIVLSVGMRFKAVFMLFARIIIIIYILIPLRKSMSEQKAVQEQPLNLREQYKLQKLQQLNQIYYCQCGKNYLTFSALYLHARNKHEVKLTTKRNSSNSKVEQKEEKTIITYFIRPQASLKLQQDIQQSVKEEVQNSQEKNRVFSAISQAIQLYLQQDLGKHSHLQDYHNLVIQQFLNYFQFLEELQATKYPTELEAITLYYNDFICNYIPLAHSQKIISLQTLAATENQLIKLWRWLRENKYIESELFHRNYPHP